jgi:hypothetical protein
VIWLLVGFVVVCALVLWITFRLMLLVLLLIGALIVALVRAVLPR